VNFSVKLIKIGNVLVLSIFRNGVWVLLCFIKVIFDKSLKSLQTKIYYKFALA
jgi:hypothetical protein